MTRSSWVKRSTPAQSASVTTPTGRSPSTTTTAPWARLEISPRASPTVWSRVRVIGGVVHHVAALHPRRRRRRPPRGGCPGAARPGRRAGRRSRPSAARPPRSCWPPRRGWWCPIRRRWRGRRRGGRRRPSASGTMKTSSKVRSGRGEDSSRKRTRAGRIRRRRPDRTSSPAPSDRTTWPRWPRRCTSGGWTTGRRADPNPADVPADRPRPRPRGRRRAARSRCPCSTWRRSPSGVDAGAGPAQLRRPGPTGRGARLPPLLGGRAPQHAGHRLVLAGRAARPPGLGHHDDAARLGWGDAAQPPAAGRRRAVRDAGRRCTPAASTSGIGRAPGTDQLTARALRRTDRARWVRRTSRASWASSWRSSGAGGPTTTPTGRSGPCPAPEVPPSIWLLGSSGYSAQLAGMLGLPFAFAHHFSARNTEPALELYRRSFQPSEVLRRALRDDRRGRGVRRHRRGGPLAAPRPRACRCCGCARAGRAPSPRPRRRPSTSLHAGRGGVRPATTPARTWSARPSSVRAELAELAGAHRRRRADDHHQRGRPRGARAQLLRAGGRGGRATAAAG